MSCIKCDSSATVVNIKDKGDLCLKCYNEWKIVYNSTKEKMNWRAFDKIAWNKMWLAWLKLINYNKKEIVMFT